MRVVRNLLAIAALVLTPGTVRADTAAQSQVQANASPRCPPDNCRATPWRVNLRTSNGGEYDAAFAPTPYVYDGTITIFPGETLVFRFADFGDTPGNPIFVRSIVGNPVTQVPPSNSSFTSTATTSVQHDPNTGENFYVVKPGSPFAPTETAAQHLSSEPSGTLILSYYQVDGRSDMVLRIEHNFPKPLKFDTQIDRLTDQGSTGLQPTSTCPVQPVLADLETWPYPIGAITVNNFRFIDTSAGFVCN